MPQSVGLPSIGHKLPSLRAQQACRPSVPWMQRSAVCKPYMCPRRCDALLLHLARYGTATPHRRSAPFAKPNGAGVNGPGGARVMSAVQNSATMAIQKHSQKPSI